MLTDATLTLNCAIASKWILSMIWQACYKISKICFLYTFYRPNEKIAKIWCFSPTSPFYDKFTDVISILFIFIFFANLKTYELINL